MRKKSVFWTEGKVGKGERQVSNPSSKFGSGSPRKNGPDFDQFTLFFLFTKKSEDFVFYPYTQNPSIRAELAA
jgi:hypothetical protein